MKEAGAVLGIGEARVSQLHSAAIIRLRARRNGRELLKARRRGLRGDATGGQRVKRLSATDELKSMEKILNQDEIDALFHAARDRAPDKAVRKREQARHSLQLSPRRFDYPRTVARCQHVARHLRAKPYAFAGRLPSRGF